MGTPTHSRAFSDRRLDIALVAGALATLHRVAGQDHTGDRDQAQAQITAPTNAEVGAALNALAAADCYGVVAGIQAYHMDTMGWNDVAYNGIVCPHGYVFEGRGPGLRSGANGDANVNATHYALCFLGGEGDTFSDEAHDAYEDGYRWLFGTDNLDAYEWAGHRDLTSTACPGGEIYDFAHGAHPWRGGSTPPPPEPPEEDEMSQAVFVSLDLSQGEQAREVGLPSPQNSGAVPFGNVHGSFSVGEFPGQKFKQVGLIVVKHRNDGTGVGVPDQDPAGIVWIPVASGRHGHFSVEPGEESVQVALAPVEANPPYVTVDLLFEISKG